MQLYCHFELQITLYDRECEKGNMIGNRIHSIHKIKTNQFLNICKTIPDTRTGKEMLLRGFIK